MNVSRVTGADHKRAAVEQWTADPCGAVGNPAEPGSRAYFDRLVETRLNYAPWMREELGYHETNGLDVLDVGCGQGIDLVLYARAGAHVTGVDLTPRHVELARLHLDRAGCAGEIVEGDAENLPFADASFDRVSSNGVLHHTPDMRAALAELFRVLRPGGEARIIVYNRRSFHYWLSQVLWHGILQGRLRRTRSMVGVLSETVEYTSVGAHPLVRAYTPGELRRLLGDAGFSEMRTVVRHFRAEDLRPTRALARTRIGRLLLSESVVEKLGHVGGWYITAIGRKPA